MRLVPLLVFHPFSPAGLPVVLLRMLYTARCVCGKWRHHVAVKRKVCACSPNSKRVRHFFIGWLKMAVESINTHIRTKKKTCYENISNSTVSPAAKLQLMQFSNYYAQIPIEGWVFFCVAVGLQYSGQGPEHVSS